MTIRPKTVVTMKLEGHAASHARTDISVRDLEVVIDEPEARGGTNQGPSPTETLMAALIGCTNVITHKIAHKHGIEIKSLDVRVETQFDRRGVSLEEEIAVPFPEIKLIVDLTTDASPEAVEMVKTELAKFCPVSKVLRQSGTVITEEWNVTPA
ncbi:MAG: OsmC family protein [SAR324 cluster bacterium]|nr:OsmC family protein [SAR324 cluster bacterium]MCH8885850.1 OsmC family protein [SAR324 cluster bacterium]